jgi:hypothetical protein
MDGKGRGTRTGKREAGERKEGRGAEGDESREWKNQRGRRERSGGETRR